MLKIKNNLHGYYVDHPTYGAIFLPEDMTDFIEMYMSDMTGMEQFVFNYNATVEDKQ